MWDVLIRGYVSSGVPPDVNYCLLLDFKERGACLPAVRTCSGADLSSYQGLRVYRSKYFCIIDYDYLSPQATGRCSSATTGGLDSGQQTYG